MPATLAFHTGTASSSQYQLLHFWTCFLRTAWEKQWTWTKCLDPCHSCGDSAEVPTSWLYLGQSWQLQPPRSGPRDEKPLSTSLSLFLQLFQIKKQFCKNTFKFQWSFLTSRKFCSWLLLKIYLQSVYLFERQNNKERGVPSAGSLPQRFAQPRCNQHESKNVKTPSEVSHRTGRACCFSRHTSRELVWGRVVGTPAIQGVPQTTAQQQFPNSLMSNHSVFFFTLILKYLIPLNIVYHYSL